VEISAAGKPGVRLREDVGRGHLALKVPREAWLAVPLELPEPEVELAWRLLEERWRGPASEFAPYIDFLWSVDLSLHPVFWEDREVAWLRVSTQAHEEVVEVREAIAARLRALARRAAQPGSPAPPELRAEPEELQEALTFALLLVEARAMEAEPATPGEPSYAAMVPLLDHLSHDASQTPGANVGVQEDLAGVPMCAMADRDLKAGEELRHCYEAASGARLLARYGAVPEVKGRTLRSVLLSNEFSSVAVPVFLAEDTFHVSKQSCMQQKQQLLAERAGLDLRRGSRQAAARLTLPQDMQAGGRMLPAARFLVTTVEGYAVESLYELLFLGVGEGAEAQPSRPPPDAEPDVRLEISARATAWEWCERLLNRYQKAVEFIARDVGLDLDASPMAALQADARRKAPPAAAGAPKVGEVVQAHYKAKRAGGGSGKSSRPREARLIARAEGRATLQFLANGVRHTVPEDWIVADSAPEAPSPESEAQQQLRRERAYLAISMLTTEAGLIEAAYAMTQTCTRLGLQMLQARADGSPGEIYEATDQWRRYWEGEQRQLHGDDALKELPEDLRAAAEAEARAEEEAEARDEEPPEAPAEELVEEQMEVGGAAEEEPAGPGRPAGKKPVEEPGAAEEPPELRGAAQGQALEEPAEAQQPEPPSVEAAEGPEPRAAAQESSKLSGAADEGSSRSLKAEG